MSEMAKKNSRMLAVMVIVVALLVGLARISKIFPPIATEMPPPAFLSEGFHRVERVVDGDTLLLENRARIRLIGVDTPETVRPDHPVEPFGPEATEFTREKIESVGGEVRLVFDGDRKDRYDRFLAHVYVGEELLNESLVRSGLARARTEFNYSEEYKKRYRRAEKEARDSNRGIWSLEENRFQVLPPTTLRLRRPDSYFDPDLTRSSYPAFFAA
jgi:micrococcal nuclease